MRRVGAAGAAVLLSAVLGSPLAHAAFTAPVSAETTLSTASLGPASGLTAAVRCTLALGGLVVAAKVDLAWTPSTTPWANGQRVEVRDGLGLAVASQDLSATATSTTLDLPLVSGGTYTASVQAAFAGWRSPSVTASAAGC